MRPEIEAYRHACLAAKCDRCRSKSSLTEERWCSACIDNMPDYPRLTTPMDQLATQIYALLRMNDDDTPVSEICQRLKIDRATCVKVLRQMVEHGVIEADEDSVWAWDGNKPYMEPVIRD